MILSTKLRDSTMLRLDDGMDIAFKDAAAKDQQSPAEFLRRVVTTHLLLASHGWDLNRLALAYARAFLRERGDLQ
jgi:hypothetical protein